MKTKLVWYKKFCIEALWVFCLCISYMPRFVRYYLLQPFIAFILILSRYRLKVIKKNINNSFPEKSIKERKRIIRRYYCFLAEIIIDTISLAGASKKRKKRFAKWTNAKNINEKLNGQDWIAVGGHYGCWEYFLTLNREIPGTELMGVYHPMKNIVFGEFYHRLRNDSSNFVQVPMKQTILHFLRNRKNGQPTVIGLISDQSPTLRPDSHWFKFLNQDTVFHDGAESMAIKFHLPVYFAHSRRLAPGRYEYHFEEIYDGKENVERHEITKRFADKLESMIKECPELWMWSHNRWRHTPEKQAKRFGKSTLEGKA